MGRHHQGSDDVPGGASCDDQCQGKLHSLTVHILLNTQRQDNEKERFALGYYPGASAVSESGRSFV